MQKDDLDFWYNPTYNNYFKLLDALEDLGVNVTEFKEETSPDPKKSFSKIDQEQFQMDYRKCLVCHGSANLLATGLC